MNKKAYMLKYNHTKFFTILLSLLFCFGLIILIIAKKETVFNDLEKCNLNSNASSFKDFQGKFSLINEEGLTVSSNELLDKPSLLYFGYTYCPDICPFDLMRNSNAVELLELEDIKVKPIFISVDPERDTPSVLKDFTSFHHPDMVGLTGSEKQLDKVKKIYKVYSEIPKNNKKDYIVNHSTFSYFILPEDGVQTYFTRKDSPRIIADAMKCIIDTKIEKN